MADNRRTAHKRNLTATIDESRTKPTRKKSENPEPPNANGKRTAGAEYILCYSEHKMYSAEVGPLDRYC